MGSKLESCYCWSVRAGLPRSMGISVVLTTWRYRSEVGGERGAVGANIGPGPANREPPDLLAMLLSTTSR